MYLAIFLTIVPILVTASPIPLTRDNVAKHNKNEFKVVQYLVRYGHLNDKPDVRSLILSQKHQPNMAPRVKTKHNAFHPYADNEIADGIRSLQNSFGLKTTGELNKETIQIINSPRCGSSDKENSKTSFQMTIHHRNKRYNIQHQLSNGKTTTLKWNKKTITWNILIYYKYLLNKIQDETLEKAFKLWEHASPLIFTKTSSTNPDVKIEFAAGAHGDRYNFDGKGGVLAHAYPPGWYSHLAGDIHFDADEGWNIDYDLLSVALHEIGHSLGLAHSKFSRSVMYATYRKTTQLHVDDRNGVTALYGECKTRVDAAMYLWGDIYFLRKDMIWKVDEFGMFNSFDEGYPKKIKNEFNSPAIPNDVDAALRWSDQHLYFLKGTRSWGYNRFDDYIRYDDTIAKEWPKIPNSPDASLCYIDEKITWFFKGKLCWKLRDWDLSVFPGYPKNINQEWKGVPNDVDAAYYSSWSKETYFFKDMEYWVVDNNKFKQEPYQAYHGGQIHQKWKGVCSEKY